MESGGRVSERDVCACVWLRSVFEGAEKARACRLRCSVFCGGVGEAFFFPTVK